jgi:uncharacterized membrane protein YqjE
MNNYANNFKDLSTLLTELKEEFKDFLQTRLKMLKAELEEKIKMVKTAAPFAVVGILLLGTAYLLFTMALVGLVVAFLANNPYRWCFAFLTVALLWSILGGIAIYFAKRDLEFKGLIPKRTVEVLKGDKLWIQSGVKGRT